MTATKYEKKVALVTFATSEFEETRRKLVASALVWPEFRSSIEWTPESLGDQFAFQAEDFWGQRGAGYWLWKPFIILDALNRDDGAEWVMYYDSGRGAGYRINKSTAPILRWADQHNAGALPGVYVPEWGPNAWWTKRDAFVLSGCDTPKYHNCPQIQATFSFWRKSERNRAVVRKWLELCSDSRILSDAPNTCGLENHAGFIDHRHDQSVLTIVCQDMGLLCYGATTQRTEHSKDVTSLINRMQGMDFRAMATRLSRRLNYAARKVPTVNRLFPPDRIRRTLNERGYFP